MRSCEQAPGLSVWRHGEMVAQRYAELLAHLHALASGRGTSELPGWRLPDWLTEHAGLLLARQVAFDSAQRYQLYHDCGKPYCLEYDESDRRHFPGHAELSARLWRQLGGDELEARLMELDMVVHTMPASELDEFAAKPEAPTLLLTAFAEIHANASMFGGHESVSFKSKWKHLDRRGRALASRWLSTSSSQAAQEQAPA
jgi:hypothetical protein